MTQTGFRELRINAQLENSNVYKELLSRQIVIEEVKQEKSFATAIEP